MEDGRRGEGVGSPVWIETCDGRGGCGWDAGCLDLGVIGTEVGSSGMSKDFGHITRI